MSVNFVTLGLFFALSVLAFVPTGQVLPALLISGVFVTFLVITYAGLISVMPRAGGDYVWQSRVMGGGIAFVLAVTGWWFILWYWAPIYGNILNVEVLQPLAATFKWDGLSDFLATDNGLFVVILATVVLAGYLVSLGMEGYAKVQKVCFYIGMIALAVVFVVMLFGSRSGFQSAFNQETANLFGAKGDVYQQTIQLGTTNNGGPVVPDLGFSPFFGDTLLLIPFLCFWILWPNWGATLYGEVRGASDFKRVMGGMMYGLWVTVAVAVVFILLADKFFGWQFFNAANLNYWATVYGFGDATIPVWSYAPFLASFYFHSSLIYGGHRARVRRLVPRVGGDVVPLVDPGDLRCRVRSGVAREGRRRLREAARAGVGARADAGAVDRGRRPVRVYQQFLHLHPGRDVGDRGDVLRHVDRGDDPAIPEEAAVRELRDRPV